LNYLDLLLFHNVKHIGLYIAVHRIPVFSVPRVTVPTLKNKKSKKPKHLNIFRENLRFLPAQITRKYNTMQRTLCE